MRLKIIRTDEDHEAVLQRIEEIFDAKPGTPLGDELELLTMLVEQYEEKAFPIDLPDPVSAIRFRMEQQGLRPKDLEPFIGSSSKVSEVLSGRRGLSIAMIRKLTDGLQIPAEVLLQEDRPAAAMMKSPLNGHHLPVVEMARRGWFEDFDGTSREARDRQEELLSAFIAPLGKETKFPALDRGHLRSGRTMDNGALLAWRIRVVRLAMKDGLPNFLSGTVTPEFMRDLVRLSYLDEGPRLARQFLEKKGIHFVVERHLPKTYLDGAAIRLPNGAPLIALTLRHDRLDNFWFTLLHEMAHLSLHLDDEEVDGFFDDLDRIGTDRYEREADKLATEILIPDAAWKRAQLRPDSSPEAVVRFAESLCIHPSIPAGRLRYESGNYALFGALVGRGLVRSALETR